MHNDSGDTARLFAVGPNGRTLGRFTLAGVEALDWEDIAAGPGPGAGRRYLYVGDIGDNDRDRRTISILRLPEPVVEPGAAPVSRRRRRGQTRAALSGRCPRRGGAARGSPLRRPVDRDERARRARPCLPSPGRLAAGSETTLRRVATLRLGLAVLVTGGDVSRSGSVVALRTYGSVLLCTPGREAAVGGVPPAGAAAASRRPSSRVRRSRSAAAGVPTSRSARGSARASIAS